MNMLRRQQMSWIFELVKLALLGVSGYLTYGFLSRFLPDFWFRILALVLYEVGLLAWHYIHHWKAETPRQHQFSKNMEHLCLLAVASAAGFQLLSLVSAGFGDHLPGWIHSVVEVVTVLIFLVQVWAFTHWEKLSRYYLAVEHSHNRELAGNQTGMISAALAQVDTVKVVESDQNSAALPAPSEADVDTSSNAASGAQNTLEKVVKLLPQSTKRVRLADRIMALEALAEKHPELTTKQLAEQVGLSASTVREWRAK